MRLTLVLWLIVPLQMAATGFFIWDVGAALFGFRSEPLSWQVHEAIELGAALGLLIGFALGMGVLIVTMRRNRGVEGQLRAASGAFAELLEERFQEWGLTPAERDVAWLTLKGFSNAEIARLRKTSDGTVKAQSYAIYRKANVTGRPQLLSLFIEDLLDANDGPAGAASAEQR